MKLPDFTKFEPLNHLRNQMGATELGTFKPSYSPDKLTLEELNRLARSGIDIPLDELRVLKDGTLAYKDSRVLLYIRDVYLYKGGEETLPKFHVSDCRTLQDMRDKKRFERYVVAIRDDGSFELNIAQKGADRLLPAMRRLNVCQNCLAKLRFDGFDYSLPHHQKMGLVSGFSIARFFGQYPKSLVVKTPKHTAASAPRNEYSSDFKAISDALKRALAWTCESCKRDCSSPALRRFLNAHHIDGQRNDNSRGNLRVLCLGCHANEPMHGHLKRLPEYWEFLNAIKSS